jgi:iron complex transport system ATP-binding protein
MLDVSQLSVSLSRKQILVDIGFRVTAGTMLAVLGRNGAGKTTLIHALAGIVPMQGNVLLDGEALAGFSPAERGRKIGYVAQDPAALSAHLSVLELLVLVQNTHVVRWRARDETVAAAVEVLEALHLSEFAQAVPAQLSGGERQMVALALALVRGPRLLLLDEPTSALDIANQLHLLTLVRDYTRRAGIVTLLILHDLNLVTRFADTALMLDRGTVAVAGPVRDLLNHDLLADIYGIEFHVADMGDGHVIVYPALPR